MAKKEKFASDTSGRNAAAWAKALVILLVGLTVAHLGVTLFLLSELGTDTFTVFIQGLSRVFGLTVGTVHVIVLCILKFSGLAALAPDGESILLISLLAASAPAASNVTQIAQVYGHEGDNASAINAITTLLCIGTMPLIVFLYQL